METTILVCFELDGYDVEIDLPVTFTPVKGYPQTHWEPGEPDHIDDIDFDEFEALALVGEDIGVPFNFDWAIECIEVYLEDSEVEGKLLDVADQAGRDYEDEKAEYLYEQMRERRM